MGSVVTRSVPDFHLVVGNPARSIAALCRCGEPFTRLSTGSNTDGRHACARCGRAFDVRGKLVAEVS